MAYKRPESVLVIIYTKAGDVLLLERVNPPEFWQSVTGSLKEDESAIDAAQRELQEETGLAVQPINTDLENSYPIAAAWRQRYAPEISHNHETVFVVELDTRPEVILNSSEHRQYCWLPREQAAAKVCAWTNRDAILALVPEKH